MLFPVTPEEEARGLELLAALIVYGAIPRNQPPRSIEVIFLADEAPPFEGKQLAST